MSKGTSRSPIVARARLEIDGHPDAGLGLDGRPDALDVGLGDDAGDEALLARVAAEDVGEPGAQHDLEAEVAQRPDGVLAAGAGAEVGAGDEDARALRRRAG